MALLQKLIPLLLLSTLAPTGQSASILFYFAVANYSHRILVWTYVAKLAELGHDVTFLSGYKPRAPIKNVTEFHPQSLQDLIARTFGAGSDMIKAREEGKAPDLWRMLEALGIETCETLMMDPEYVKFVRSKKFDLIVVDALNNECALGIAKLHSSKVIIFSTNHPLVWQYDMFGISPESSWIPSHILLLPREMNFAERVVNTFLPLYWYFHRVYISYPAMERAINEGLGWEGEDRISLRDMEAETDLVLYNSHFSVDYARSLPPLYVPVCGLHIEKGKNQLPKDILKFADESGDAGFIYVSFGSAIMISKASQEIRNTFFHAFGNSSIRFIWKWDGPRPDDMPSNVFTAPWMPQADVLAHPKVKAFITHAGLLGTAEGIANAVPLITFPCFAEQDYNADRTEFVGYGIKLEFVGLRQEDLQNAIQRILTEPSYKEAMQEISKRFKDRQNDPLETAVWWTEYVLRNKRTNLLLPLGRRQFWFVRRSLDVWGLIIGTLGLALGLVLCSLCQRRQRKISSSTTDKKIKRKKQ